MKIARCTGPLDSDERNNIRYVRASTRRRGAFGDETILYLPGRRARGINPGMEAFLRTYTLRNWQAWDSSQVKVHQMLTSEVEWVERGRLDH